MPHVQWRPGARRQLGLELLILRLLAELCHGVPIQVVLLLAAARPVQLDPDTNADVVFVSNSLSGILLPREVLDVVEGKLQLVGRMDIALPADINQMPPLVCLLPSLLFIVEQRVAKQ